jgi:hypothetical protein
MKAKFYLTVVSLLMLLTSAAMAATGPNVSQNIDQNANQVIRGSVINNSTINQSISQRANQNFLGTGLGGNINSNQNIDQSAGQSIQGSNIRDSTISQGIVQGAAQNTGGLQTNASLSFSQNIGQEANQSLQGVSLWNASLSQNIVQGANQSIAWSNQSYFVMNDQTVTMTADQRAALMARTNDFISTYPNNRMYIMPLVDLNAFNTAGRGDVVVLNVGFGAIPLRFSSLPVINIPLNQLTARIGEIPTGSTIAVISGNDMTSATAATLLRMQGYNAWAVNTGAC